MLRVRSRREQISGGAQWSWGPESLRTPPDHRESREFEAAKSQLCRQKDQFRLEASHRINYNRAVVQVATWASIKRARRCSVAIILDPTFRRGLPKRHIWNHARQKKWARIWVRKVAYLTSSKDPPDLAGEYLELRTLADKKAAKVN